MPFFVFLPFKKKQEKRTSDEKMKTTYGIKRERAKRLFYTQTYAKIFDSEKAVGGA